MIVNEERFLLPLDPIRLSKVLFLKPLVCPLQREFARRELHLGVENAQ